MGPLLTLSPFYRRDASQAPGFAIRPLIAEDRGRGGFGEGPVHRPDKALEIPTQFAEANDLKVRTHGFGVGVGLGHNIVNPDALGAWADEVLGLCVDLYENG
ncbi:hypothetical protein [Kineosporia sp. NBRC 101731]|uniref:hypothetical protein n=1 Tax=Kineosporia sp. NBRC 101731 TaxID=3032199 RepID=UPI00249FFC47|nr:hypothetical protein [Kineosporia sp. NBRC 101731]GLY28854.1 hypothetical protein Kisp02_22190 [Kineosporia sp. NBRC 101731]